MNKSTIKLLIVGDLHGQIPKIRFKDFDAIICPGDLCGDDIRPYIKKWIKKRTKLKSDVDFDEICPRNKQEEYRKVSMKKGREVLKYLNSLKVPVILVPGNWDMTPHINGGIRNNKNTGDKNYWEDIKKGLKNIYDVEFGKKTFKGLSFIGHGSTSMPEILKKPTNKNEDNYREKLSAFKFFTKVNKKLNNLFSKEKNPIILISHNVPYKTKLDKVNAPGTYAHNKHYGSIIAKDLIKKYQPMLCIGGHIHEGFGKTRVGKTLCINAGFGGSVNTLVEIDVKKNKIVNIETKGKSK